jgi:uncharacterized membrane protein YuzA (DUF378 family)
MFKKSTRKVLDVTALSLIIVGGITWGTSLFNYNVVQSLANMSFPQVSTIIYSLVALSSLFIGLRVGTGKLLQ